MTYPTRILVALIASLALIAAAPAGAIVPPKNCGTTTISGKRYQVKADQFSCTTAKRYARTLITRKRRPSGYKCTRGPSRSKLVYQCVNTKASPDRTFWVYKR